MRDAIEAERRALEKEVRLLGKALDQLEVRETFRPDAALPVEKKRPTVAPRSSRRRIRVKKTATEKAAENRERIVMLLLQRGGRMSPEAIKAQVPMTQGQAGAVQEAHGGRSHSEARTADSARVRGGLRRGFGLSGFD